LFVGEALPLLSLLLLGVVRHRSLVAGHYASAKLVETAATTDGRL
jgi:hypothetical protein